MNSPRYQRAKKEFEEMVANDEPVSEDEMDEEDGRIFLHNHTFENFGNVYNIKPLVVNRMHTRGRLRWSVATLFMGPASRSV